MAGDAYGSRPDGRSAGDLLDPFGSEDRDPYAARRTQRYDPYQNWPGRNRYGQAQPSPFGDDGETQRPRRRDPDYLFGEDPRY